jgi:hypothetical protein
MVVDMSSRDGKWVIASGIPSRPSSPLRMMEQTSTTGYSRRRFAATPFDLHYGWSLSIHQAGWPTHAFEGATELDPAGNSRTFSVAFIGRAMPTKFLWPGFAINTIFYAAMLWVLCFATAKIRRFIIVRGRIRGHRCPACGYQIAPGGGIGPVCSECGEALPKGIANSA